MRVQFCLPINNSGWSKHKERFKYRGWVKFDVCNFSHLFVFCGPQVAVRVVVVVRTLGLELTRNWPFFQAISHTVGLVSRKRMFLPATALPAVFLSALG